MLPSALCSFVPVPHLQPELLDILLMKNENTGQSFTQLGGQKGAHGVHLPTGETAVFLLAGNNLHLRYQLLQLFDDMPLFCYAKYGSPAAGSPHEPRLSGLLTPSAEYLSLLTTGEHFKPVFSAHFPG